MRVGFRTGLVLDHSRLSWDGNNPRPCSWAAWYPANDDAAEAEMFAGPPGASWFAIGSAAMDAALATAARSWPVALLSHGTGGSALDMGWLGRRLAQHGVTAIAANHHGNNSGEPYRAEGFLCWWERARDLSVLLDTVPGLDGFAGRIERDHALVAGFSLGGHSAMALLGAVTDMSRFQAWALERGLDRGPHEFPDLAERFPALMETNSVFRSSWDRQSCSCKDDRVSAALLLAPAPPVRAFDEASLGRIGAPVGIIVGGSDVEAPAEDGAVWLHERIGDCTLDRLAPAAGHHVFLPEATEAGYRDAPHFCRDAAGVDRRAIHDFAVRAALQLSRRARA